MATMQSTKYYWLYDDIAAYPDAWAYIIYSMRGPGKTYGFFWGALRDGLTFIYLKRTVEDVKLMLNEDFSPLMPINRDHGTSYELRKVDNGILGVFDGPDSSIARGYVMAASVVYRYKGFGQRVDPDLLCFDEFIPQIGERVRRNEGDMILDFYMSLARDREARGKLPLKLVLFANTITLHCPLTLTLRVLDDMEDMESAGEDLRYLADRKILLHHLKFSASVNNDSPIVQAMRDTQWGRMAFAGEFSYSDRSKVRKKQSLKNASCLCSLTYNGSTYYIYFLANNGSFYCSKTRPGKGDYDRFNCEIDADVRRFYRDYAIMLRGEITDNNMLFCDYTSYYLIYNFKTQFQNL